MQLFFNAEIQEDSKQISFSKEESRHIVKALRKKVGDTLYITNGKGWEFTALVVSDDIKNCVAEITTTTYHKPLDYNLHLAVAPTKMNDRYEWFLEKSTEIGVSTITPIICDNSERKVIKKERFEKILQSAMKQSLQHHLPQLNDAMPFQDFLNKENKGQCFIAHCYKTQRKSLKSEVKPNTSYTILIGPEGDFSPQEIALALSKNYIPVTLGKNRLRTETAAIAASHTIALLNEL